MVWLEDNPQRASSPIVENGFSNETWSSSITGALSPSQKAIQGNDTLSYANNLRATNNFSAAFDLYEAVLEKDSKNVEAHIGKSICAISCFGKDLAFAYFSDAINLDPHNACALTHCGIIRKEEGSLVEAMNFCKKALAAVASYKPAAECLALILAEHGTSLKVSGNNEEGIQKYKEALEIDPHCGSAYYSLADMYNEMMQYDNALASYEKAAFEKYKYVEANYNMGNIYKKLDDWEMAIACDERCLAVSPNVESVKNEMSLARTKLGTKFKLEDNLSIAVKHYKKALYYKWQNTDAMLGLGEAYADMQKSDMDIDMATMLFEFVAHFNPNCVEAHNDLGLIYQERGNLEKAVECYKRAVSVKPNFAPSLNNLGVVYQLQGKVNAATYTTEKAILADHQFAEAFNNLGALFKDTGHIDMAIFVYEQWLKRELASRSAVQNLLLARNYICEGLDDKLFEAHRDWGMQFTRLHPQYTSWDNLKDSERPITIGYISPDFFSHSVSYFIEAPLTHHDKTKYSVVVYSAVKADAKTNRIRNVVLKNDGVWKDICGRSEKEIACMVREDKIDILVELTGHMANNKLETMARRPAPVQVTWIGYPNTTGLPTVDYRITDSLADPLDIKQKHVEQLVRLPECFLCYTPSPEEAGPVCPTPALSNGFVTFGCFDNRAKITPGVLQVWAKILCLVPNSRLVFKCKSFTCAIIKHWFLRTLEKLGLASIRVELLPPSRSNHDHMQAYSLMDISLDTFPYAGTTTTCESLYMGVPCVTMAGSVHAHNVGVSLLSKVGLGDLVAKNEDEYVRLSVNLASDVTALSKLRMSLRDLMAGSPVCNGPSFAVALESAYRNMWRKYCKGEVPSLRRLEMLQKEVQEDPLISKDLGSSRLNVTGEATPSLKANGSAPVPSSLPTQSPQLTKRMDSAS